METVCVESVHKRVDRCNGQPLPSGMRPTWTLLLVLPLVALAVWGTQLAASRSRVSIEAADRVPTLSVEVAQACARHLGSAGGLVDSGMGYGFTAITEGDVTTWSLSAGWRATDGQVSTLDCKGREQRGRVTVQSAGLS